MRAIQFAPFAALSGHSDAISETGRWTDQPIELDEERRVELDRQLSLIAATTAATKTKQEIAITYFVNDAQKQGGFYHTIQGTLKEIDITQQKIKLEDGTIINIQQITNITPL